MQHRTLGLICLTFIVGCSGGKKTEVVEEPPAEKPAKTATVDKTPMLRHWVTATKVRDGVVSGNLDETLMAAGEMHEGPESPPVAWMPFVELMNEHIGEARSAASLQDAAVATANLGATCGNCHTATQAQVQMAKSDLPAIGDDPHAHMQRHQWAVNAMWEGLVVPSNGRWVDGLGVLAEKPLHNKEKSSQYVGNEELEQFGETIHDLGVRGVGVPPTERAAIFAELITACGDCHAQTLSGPK